MTPMAAGKIAPERKPSLQIPSLDGLRALSFGIVFLAHACSEKSAKWVPGELGLAVFFFLSGYLITTLLRMEFDRSGRINFKDFYLRRVLRIFPPFYLVLGAACLLTLTGVLDNTLWPRAVLAQAFHLTNYWVVFHGWWYGIAPGSWIFWSLAVEEHFYLLFPLIYFLMRRRGLTAKQQMGALLSLCVALLLWRCLLVFGFHADKDRVYAATDTRVDSILFGCILAVYGNPFLDEVPCSEQRLKQFWVPLALAAILVSFAAHRFWFDQTVRYTIQGAALIPIFIVAVRYPWWGIFRGLNHPWVRFLGLLSYSLYLMHTIALYGLSLRTHWPRPVVAVAALAICIGLATLIYHFVEKPCARLRKRLSHARRSAAEAPAAASMPEAASASPSLSRSHLVARNVLATLGTQLISWTLTFAVTLYLPRYVGDVGLGKLAFAASFISMFGVIVPLGTSTLLVKEIARDRGRTGELLLAALLLRLPLAVVMTAVAVAVVSLLGYPELTRTLVTVAALGMIIGTTNEALGAALQGQENLPRQSAGVLVDKFLASGLMIFLILRHAPLWSLAAVGIWTGLASLLVNLSAFRPLLPTLRLPHPKMVRQVALTAMPFMGWTVFQTLYGQTDPVILSLVTNDATVGWYAAAFRLVGTTLFLPTALTTAMLPTLARLHGESASEFRALARRMLALVMLCGVPIALVLLLLPDRLIALLHYPAGFQHSIPVLRVGGLGVLLWFAGNALGTTIFAADGQARMFRTSVMATLIGIPACFLGSWLGHHFWHNGAVGAISSDVLLEAYLICSYLRLLPSGTFDGESLSGVGRCLAASLPMAGLLALLTAQGWGLWSLPPCLLIYAGMCAALGCLRLQDVQAVGQMWKGRVRT